jgi:hypothetical protein
VANSCSRLIGPFVFLRPTGLRAVTRADCEKVVDDFLAAHTRR